MRMNVNIPEIKNGSQITIGSEKAAFTIKVDQHLYWFQKKMMKWCFGCTVIDYPEIKNDKKKQ